MGDRVVSTLDHTHKPEATTARQLEVITGTGRRRWFSADDKARMIEETLDPPCEQLLRRKPMPPRNFRHHRTRRRQARQHAGADAAPEVPQFVPAVVERALPEGAVAADSVSGHAR